MMHRDAAVPAIDSEPAPACPHARVRDTSLPGLVKGSPDGRTDSGYHVAQRGHCVDCGQPVLRLSPHVALSSWALVTRAEAPSDAPRGFRRR